MQIRRRECEVLAESKRRSDSDAFVNWTTHIAADSKRTEDIEIDIFRNRNGDLYVVPLLRICL